MDPKIKKGIEAIVARLIRRYALDAVFSHSLVTQSLSKEKLDELRAQIESNLVRLEEEGSEYEAEVMRVAVPLLGGMVKLGRSIGKLFEGDKKEEER